MKDSKIRENQRKTQEKLKEYSQMPINRLLKEFKSSIDGLSVVDIEERLNKCGKNTIELKNENSWYKRLYNSLVNPFNIVLIVVAIITFVTDIVISSHKDYATFTLMVSIVMISTIISYIQETKSDNAAKKLKNMISNQIDVIRNGNPAVAIVEEIVPGDIIKLSSGDMIPGDVRILEAKDLFIDQASLTGESNPVEKYTSNQENN